MRRPFFSAWITVSIGTALTLAAACTTAVDEEHPPEELAAHMGVLQRHAEKLGYSIQERHPRLAPFYARKVRESLGLIRNRFPRKDGYPLAELIDDLALAEAAAVESAVGREAWNEADRTYAELIDNCNACHAATEHEFLVILPAGGTPPYNQQFSTD